MAKRRKSSKKKSTARRKNQRTRQLTTGKVVLSLVIIVCIIGGFVGLWLRFFGGSPVDYAYYQSVASQYAPDYLDHQLEIEQLIEERGDRPADVGHLFIPRHPAQLSSLESADQIDIPYFNQNDPRWANVSYGTDDSRKLWENGCAIISLAMVDAYYGGPTSPQSIARWAGDTYYLHHQGTAWSIYHDFGEHFGYQVTDLGNDFTQAMHHIQSGHPVIVAVGPGAFTRGGHVMVVRGYDGYNVYLNDPNDSPDFFWSIQPVAAQTLIDSSLNYWVFQPQ